MASSDLRDELDCSICLDIFRDPVTLSCGHNFCRVCIDRVLDTQDGSGDYSCPDCREEFQERPPLMRNSALRNIMENFLFTPPAQTETGICCTYCVDSPVPAVRSCLICEASLCEKHLRVHSKSPEHVLSDPSTSLQNRKCSTHKELLEYYCFEDATPICSSCYLFGGHKKHQVEILDEASKKTKELLRNFLQGLSLRREETDKKVQSLQDHRREVQGKASHLTERVTTLFIDVRTQLDNLEKKVLGEITRQEEQVSLSVSDLINNLETKTEELTEKIRCLEVTCNLQDSLDFLRESVNQKLWEDKSEGDVTPHIVSDLDEGLISDTLHKDLEDIVSGVKKMFYVEKKSDDLIDPTKMAPEERDNASFFRFLPINRLFHGDRDRWSLFPSRDQRRAHLVPAPSVAREPFLLIESPSASSRSENKGLFSNIPDVTLPTWDNWLKK
ncbi:E3 ubiquitin/ISG15 ligase TRIM25-like [Anomaloglossus baeobatrachus]|uniref:E3 ubiquitin/ISG15 ligase TRIM25-like n=1 Tax=Anomaloglossus baeobatrachus TaxID=238106 RepID=UPI003F509C79